MATLTKTAIRVRTAAGWQDIAIQGAQGAVGPPGAQGPQGIQGAQGAQGPAGALPVAPFYSTGPQPGSGGAVNQGTQFVDSGVLARQLKFTTPAYITRALITWKQRWDCQSAAWSWIGGGVQITPTPVKDYDGIASTGQPSIRSIVMGYAQGGATYALPHGAFYADLAASTAYTIVHAGNAGIGNWIWDLSWSLQVISARLEPR